MFYLCDLLLAYSESFDILAEIELWCWVVLSRSTDILVARLGEVVRSTWRLSHIDLWNLRLCELLTTVK